MRNFYISEGNFIGGQEAQAFGTTQQMVKAGAALTKGQPVYISGNWVASPATNATKCHGFAFDDYAVGANVVIVTEGLIKAECGSAITAGDEVAIGANSKIVTAGAEAYRIGYALNTTTLADQPVYIKLTLGGLSSDVVGPTGPTYITLLRDISDLAAGADVSGDALFVVPTGKAAQVVSAHIISGGAAAGVDDSNTSVFALKQGTTTICSKTFNTGTAFPASGAAVAFGAIDADHDDLAAGAVLLLDITNGATANLPVCKVQVLVKLTDAA